MQMGPGPDGNGMFLHNMSCSAWEIHDSVFTDKPLLRIAPKLPFPTGRPLVTTSTKAAPWVQGIDDCDGLQVSHCQVQACHKGSATRCPCHVP